MQTMAWPAIEVVDAVHVRLEPLAVGHATQMVEVLADSALYRYTGGTPPTLPELQQRYAAQAVGHSADEHQWWLNWIVTSRANATALGFVQATVERHGTDLQASVAWVIAPGAQGRGLATEAGQAMLHWLRGHHVHLIVANVHPDHAASNAVARKLGLHPTTVIENGEVRWQSTTPP
jgi:RimJ/RimL family protein N-acetyltransferase